VEISPSDPGHYGHNPLHFQEFGFQFNQPANQTCASGVAAGSHQVTWYYDTGIEHELWLWGYDKQTGGISIVDLDRVTAPAQVSVVVPFTIPSNWGGYAMVAIAPGATDIDAFFEITNTDAVTGVSGQRTGTTSVRLTWVNDDDDWTPLTILRDGAPLSNVVDAAGLYDDVGVTQTSHTYTLFRTRDLPEEPAYNIVELPPPGYNRSRAGPPTIVNVNLPPLVITTSATLPAGVMGQSYSYALQATGGYGTYSWSKTGGSLPTGVSLSTGGVVSGTPTTSGNYSFTAQVAAGGATASKQFSLAISQPPPDSVSVAIDGPVEIGSLDVCQWTAAVSGGQGPYSYEWKKNFTVVSTAPYWSGGGTSTFILKLKVTDIPTSQVANTAVKVTVYPSEYVNPC
jgi:hypothetical protein